MLYGNVGTALVVMTDDGWDIAGRSEVEYHVVKKEVEKIERDFPVLYTGSDINKIAKAEELSYRDELKNFVRIFTDDKGKAFYILR